MHIALCSSESLWILFYCSFCMRIRSWEEFSSSIVPILLVRTLKNPEGEWKGKEAVHPAVLIASISFFSILITLIILATPRIFLLLGMPSIHVSNF